MQLHKSYWVFIEHCVLALRRRAEGGARGAKQKTLPALRSLPTGREAIQRLFPRMSCEAALRNANFLLHDYIINKLDEETALTLPATSIGVSAPLLTLTAEPRMKRLFRITALALLALTVFSSCKSTQQPTDAPDTSSVPEALITVHNSNVLDMTVYVQRNTQRIRLGMVTAGNEKTFTLSEYLIADAPFLRFIADPIGSARSILIEELNVFPGDEIALYISARRLY